MKKILLSILLCTSYAFDNVVVPASDSKLKMTIYNDNRAFVNDVREVNVSKGMQKIVYEGVPSSVITQSVIPTFTGVNTRLYSQNYMYDLISLESMLKNSINKEIDFYTNEKEPKRTIGRLLSVNPVMVQENNTETIYTLNKPTQVLFSHIPKQMITKPSLLWNIEAQTAGKLEIDLKYLTQGISWKSDYVLSLSKDTFDLIGWITVNNTSGVAYENAEITCLAGEVNKVKKKTKRMNRMLYATSASPAMDTNTIKEESFAGYHIYKIPFRETIENKQQKQIRFIEKKAIAYRQYGLYKNAYFSDNGETKLVFINTLTFENTKKNNMGISLPKGTLRMYQKDSRNQTHFIGEDRLGNVAEDENVTVRIGTLFDAVGEKIISKFISKDKFQNVETTYNVRNQGKESLVLKIREQLPSHGTKIVVKTSCKGRCTVEKINAFVQEFSIALKAKEAYSFTSEFSVDF